MSILFYLNHPNLEVEDYHLMPNGTLSPEDFYDLSSRLDDPTFNPPDDFYESNMYQFLFEGDYASYVDEYAKFQMGPHTTIPLKEYVSGPTNTHSAPQSIDFKNGPDEFISLKKTAAYTIQTNLEYAIRETTFLPARRILEAQLALLKHDFKTSRELLHSAGWNILLSYNLQPLYPSWDGDLVMGDTMLPPWKYDSKYQIPSELQIYWIQAKDMAEALDTQEKRENTFELLMIEACEDQFNLTDDIVYMQTTHRLGLSQNWGDKIAYAVRTKWILGGINTAWEEKVVTQYEQRSSFRNLLCFYLHNDMAENLDQAVDLALYDSTLLLPRDLEESKKYAHVNYKEWKLWRSNQKIYGLGTRVIYDREKTETEVKTRDDLDLFWRNQIKHAKNANNPDKVFMYLDTLLGSDLERAVALIPADERAKIIRDIKEKAKQEHASIVDPIFNELRRKHAHKKDEVIAAVRQNYPNFSESQAFDAGIKELAEQAFAQTVAEFIKETLKKRALVHLQKAGVYDDGPFSKQLRQYALTEYEIALHNKREMDFQLKITTMLLINVPLIMCSGFVAGLARQGLRLTMSSIITGGTTEITSFSATEFVVGSAAEGWTFHTTSALTNLPIRGSAAFDNYWRECAISIGMMYTLGGSKKVYNALIGEAHMVNGAQFYRQTGEIAFEGATLIGYERLVGEPSRGGMGTLEEIPVGQSYLDAISLVAGLRGGHLATSWAAGNLKLEPTILPALLETDPRPSPVKEALPSVPTSNVFVPSKIIPNAGVKIYLDTAKQISQLNLQEQPKQKNRQIFSSEIKLE